MVKIAIVHEGQASKSHDNWLLKELISILDLPKIFEFFGVGYKSNFFNVSADIYQRLIPQIKEAEQFNKVFFVIDADYGVSDHKYGGSENVKREWQLVMQVLGIENISSLYVTCDPTTQEGYLESLLLATLDESKTACIQQFLSCSEFASKENHKAILNQIYRIAYPNAPFDLQHPFFDELKNKLRNLVS